MLHTINKGPAAPAAFDACIRVCSEGTQVLLIEDGAYFAALPAAVARLQARGAIVHVLAADADARGLTERLVPGIQRVDYAGFVQLCCEHGPVQSWY